MGICLQKWRSLKPFDSDRTPRHRKCSRRSKRVSAYERMRLSRKVLSGKMACGAWCTRLPYLPEVAAAVGPAAFLYLSFKHQILVPSTRLDLAVRSGRCMREYPPVNRNLRISLKFSFGRPCRFCHSLARLSSISNTNSRYCVSCVHVCVCARGGMYNESMT